MYKQKHMQTEGIHILHTFFFFFFFLHSQFHITDRQIVLKCLSTAEECASEKCLLTSRWQHTMQINRNVFNVSLLKLTF